MMLVNQLHQARIEARNAYREALDRGAAGEKIDPKELGKLRAEMEKTEREHEAEQMRLAAEDAALLRRPSGRIPGSRPAPGLDDDAALALGSLPQLPGRTHAALSRLYPEASGSADTEQRAENWRGVVAAALGGQALHPAVLAATATEGVPADGGFAVTVEVASGIFMRAVEESVWMRIGVRLEPMISDEKIVNAIDDSDESSDAEAGIVAEWKDEASEATAQMMKLRQVTLKARKLLVLAAASNELSEDAPDYLLALEAALSRAIAKKLDRAVLSGTGAGNPLGILNSPATITVAKEPGQSAGTFVWENATALWKTLAPGSHERSWWLIHPTVLPQGLSMSLAIGTGGTQPRGAFEAGGPTGYMLLGRPVLVTSRVKVLGTKGDIILVDPTQLAVGVRRGITIERSEQALFSSDRLAIRGKFRGDARPIWDKPRTLVEGNTTVSPVVVLENR